MSSNKLRQFIAGKRGKNTELCALLGTYGFLLFCAGGGVVIVIISLSSLLKAAEGDSLLLMFQLKRQLIKNTLMEFMLFASCLAQTAFLMVVLMYLLWRLGGNAVRNNLCMSLAPCDRFVYYPYLDRSVSVGYNNSSVHVFALTPCII